MPAGAGAILGPSIGGLLSHPCESLSSSLPFCGPRGLLHVRCGPSSLPAWCHELDTAWDAYARTLMDSPRELGCKLAHDRHAACVLLHFWARPPHWASSTCWEQVLPRLQKLPSAASQAGDSCIQPGAAASSREQCMRQRCFRPCHSSSPPHNNHQGVGVSSDQAARRQHPCNPHQRCAASRP